MKRDTVRFFLATCIFLLGAFSHNLVAQPLEPIANQIEAGHFSEVTGQFLSTSIGIHHVLHSTASGTGKMKGGLEDLIFEKEEEDKSISYSILSKGQHHSALSYTLALDSFEQSVVVQLHSSGHSHFLLPGNQHLLLQVFRI